VKLGEVRVEPLPPGPSGSPVEVSFRLDLSGVLHVSAQHLASGRSANVRIANSPYQLTEVRRAAAQAEIEALRAAGAGEGEENEVTESDLSLANAMLMRAQRAMESDAGDAPTRGRVERAAAALSRAVVAKDPTIVVLTDELSDALLDLV
jgi:molecular chaperone DnaK (HSP70)